MLAVDLSEPMIPRPRRRAVEREGVSDRVRLALAPMDTIAADSGSMDLIVAHGIWNLARSGAEFRGAVREAARVARPGAALFVFTFSRRTIAATANPVAGETFVFTQFSGQPQIFLTAEQLIAELAAAGFVPDAAVPLTEHNVPRPGSIRTGGAPVIYEGAFRTDAARRPLRHTTVSSAARFRRARDASDTAPRSTPPRCWLNTSCLRMSSSAK